MKRNTRFNTITYRLIINMSAVDILITVCNMPGRLTRQITGRHHWFYGVVGVIVCKATSFISDSTVSRSILTLTAIAFERFCLVTFPLKKIVTIKIAKFMILATWLASFLSVSPLLYAMRIQKINGFIYCYEDWSPLFDQETAAKVYTPVIMFVVLYALPLFIICVFYSCTRTGFGLCPSPVVQAGPERKEKSSQYADHCGSSVCTVLASITHFSFSLFFHQTEEYFCGIPQLSGFSIGSVSLFLSHTTSAINPCLYVAFNKT